MQLEILSVYTEYLLGVLTTSPTGLTRLSLDVQVDKEQARKEGSKQDSKVGTELNLKGEGLCRKGLDNGIEGESRCRASKGRNGKSGRGNSLGSLECSLAGSSEGHGRGEERAESQ
mmetsp:Transcript_11678/g.15246  ORF Transcript_11678/g.15246 Transcript_11678/m.15246 type:complete len:116 (-) Transcript_11678:144-491(-)